MGTEAATDGQDWIEQSDIGHTGAKQNGNDAESWVRDHYNLQGQDPDICPEYAHDAVDPRTGTPIEIKSCQIRYSDGGRRGTFQIWDYAHETLIDHGGGYIFVVHEPRGDGFHVYFHRPLSAETVDGLIGNWHPIDHDLRPDQAHRTEVAQSTIFTDIRVSRIEPEESPEEQDTEAGETTVEPGPDPDTTEDMAQVERVKEVKQIIRKLERNHEKEMAPHAAVIGRLRTVGIDPDEAEHRIEELKRRGDIYEPRGDHYRTV